MLVQEKFALQLLYQRNAHHLQRSRGDIGLLEYNRDRLYERYEKWKNKTQAERQNILNLQGQILALQNNPPNQINMAGIPHPWFDWGDSIPDFLAQLRLDLQNRGIDPAGAGANGRAQAKGYLRSCMRGRTLEWFDEEITTKTNWELTNLTDGTGQANLVAVNGRTALQIGADGLNEALGQPGNAIVKLRAVESPWDEDWHIAGANFSVNIPNAGNETTVVIVGIRFGQAIWWLKTHFPTVEEELRDIMYGTIRKGDMTIDELYRKILRIGRRANYRPEELRRKFLDALPLLWLEKAEDIGEHLPLDELAKKLYEIELRRIARHKRDKISDPLVSNQASQQIYEPLPVSAPQQHGISLEDMQKAIQNALAQQKTEYQSLLEKQKNEFQVQMAQQSKKTPPPIPPKNMEQICDSYENDNPFIGPPTSHKPDKYRSAKIYRLETIIGKVANTVGTVADFVDQLSDRMGRMSLNEQSQKPFYCSNCGQEGHKKNNCPNLNPVAKSNFTRYYPQLPSTQSQYTPPDSDNEEDGYDEENNRWTGYDLPVKKNR